MNEMIDVDEYMTSGYIRQQTLQCFKTSEYTLFQNIPDIIASVCKLYFDTIDHFEVIGRGVHVSDNKMCITKEICGWENTSYGSIKVPANTQNIHKWWFKIKSKARLTDEDQVTTFNAYIGIAAKIQNKDEIKLMQEKEKGNTKTEDFYIEYSFWNCGVSDKSSKCHIHPSKDIDMQTLYGKAANEKLDENVICMDLDLRQRTIKFHVNDEDLGIAFDEIDIGDDIDYKISVTMCSIQNYVEIIDYKEFRYRQL